MTVTTKAIRRLPPLPNLTDILKMYKIRAKKSLSQNFILDPRLLNKIVKRAGNLENKTVLEVGPGPGGITRAILDKGPKALYVIEKDSRFIPSLELLREASNDTLKIQLGDCLTYNCKEILDASLHRPWEDSPPDIHLLGNLPFHIATPYIIRLLNDMHERQNLFSFGRVPMLLTFQHEVGNRMIAPPGDKVRSRLSIITQNYAQVNYAFTIPGSAFVPKPEVDVAVMTFVPLRKPYIELPFKMVEKVATTLFMGKQKYVRNTVKNLFPKEKRLEYSELIFEIRCCAVTIEIGNVICDFLNCRLFSGVDKEKRPYELEMDEIASICYAYQHVCENYPRVNSYLDRDVELETLEYKLKQEEIEQIKEQIPQEHNKGYVFKFN